MATSLTRTTAQLALFTLLAGSAIAQDAAALKAALANDPKVASETKPNELQKTPLPLPELLTDKSITFSVFSKYVWRGATLVDGLVFQPSATLGRGNLSATAFASFSTTSNNSFLTPDRARNRWSELDLTVDYTTPAGEMEYSFGYNYYSQPNTGYKRSQEAYVAAQFPGFVSPKLTLNTGLDEYTGYYLSLAASHSIATKMANAASLDLIASIGFGTEGHNEWMYGVRTAALTDVLFGASLPVELGHGVTLTPSLAFTTLLKPEFAGTMRRSQVFFGVALGFSF